MHPEKLVLGAADCAIFGSTLGISALIGLYFRFTSKHATTHEYLFAGKNMAVLPVAFSLMATLLSAITLVGIPADMYLYGSSMAFMNIGLIIGPIVAAYVFTPVYFTNNVSTAYEYLEKRFGKVIRRIMSLMFAMSTLLYSGVSLYAPALALNAVTNLSMWVSITSLGAVCTFYCTLGGMKAVLWTDVFQAILMLVGPSVVVIRGCSLLGGVSNVFNKAIDGGRLFIPKFSFGMGAPYTFFNVVFQGLIVALSSYGGGQMQVQRLLTLKTLKRSQMASILSIPIVVAFQLLCCFAGLIIYVYFISCDPLSSPSKPIYSADQLIPYFITSTMSEFPGLTGLCISGIFCASLSTVSSAINSLAAVTSEDFIRPIFPKVSKSVFYTKVISFFYGILVIALTFLMASIGNLVRLTTVILGMSSGPNLAVLILAACTTRANQEGAVLGVLCGVAVAACLSFIPDKKIFPPLPLSNECPDLKDIHRNSTLSSVLPEVPLNLQLNETSSVFTESSTSEEPFHFSYMWISSVTLVTCLVVGYTSSLVTNCFKENAVETPEVLLSPIRVWFGGKNKPKDEQPLTSPEGNQMKNVSILANSRC